MAKNIFLSSLVLFFCASLLFGAAFQIILHDAIKYGVSDSCGHIFPANHTLLFFGLDEICQTGSTEPVIARLNTNRNEHDFEAK